ncbi:MULTISPECIES: sensor histidine kinase [unclassified Nonomuraea]|uniref:sensor histidine kinase n=1 Tax=unclassified Nonomuraea TaxID=2593643 RepID=UPI0035C0A985
MMDLSSNWLVLLWPLVIPLTWMVTAYLLTVREKSAFMRVCLSLRGQITFMATVVAVITLLTAGVGAYLLVSSSPSWPGFLQLILVLETVELVALGAWATWKVTGRLLLPLETVRAELKVINPGDRPARVSDPGNAHEITRLCRTINDVLGRLDEDRSELVELALRQRQFAFDVSHELRNPIAGLLTQLEVAQRDPCHTRWPEFLGTTLVQVERLKTITDDMLRLARVRTGAPEEPQCLDLAALVRTEISHRADRLPVRLHLTPGATVTAVPSQLGRLLANLLDNAQRHSAHMVCVAVRPSNAAVELAVGDDGPGIAVGDRERVFNRFTRLDDARRLDRNGTGLGLAIARDIARAHHGSLRVEESAAGGARFILRLPRIRPSERGPT